MSPTPDVELVVVQLELEHHAVPKTQVDANGFTHDWTILVRGPDDCKIHEFVEKVVFNLHPDFPKHKRLFKEPPYSVSESGYAGFEVPIDIFFRNKEEPRKITYNYDLFLHVSEAVHNTRREKLTFQNPSPEFKKKLLRAGGFVVGQKNSVKEKGTSSSFSKNRATKQSSMSPKRPPSINASSPPEQSTIPSQKPVHSIPKNNKINQHRVAGKDISSTQNQSKSSSSKEKSVPVKPSAKNDPVFSALFGPPIQARPSPDPSFSSVRVKTEKKEDKVSSSLSLSTTKRFLEDTVIDKKSNKSDLDRKAIKVEPSEKKTKSDVISSEVDSIKKSKDKSSDRSRPKEQSSSSKKKKKKSRSSSRSSSDDSRKNKKRDKTPPKKKEEILSSKHKSSQSSSKKDSRSDYKKSEKSCKNDNKSGPSVCSSQSSSSQSKAGSSSHKRKEVKETFSSTKLSINTTNNGVAFEIESIQKQKSWDSQSNKKSKKEEFKDEDRRSVSPFPTPAKFSNNDRDKQRKENSSPTSSIVSPTPDVGRRNGASTPEDTLANDLELSSESSPSSPESPLEKKDNSRLKRRRKHEKKEKKRRSPSKYDAAFSSDSMSSSDEVSSPPKKKMHTEVKDVNYLKTLMWIRDKIDEMKDPSTLKMIVHEIEQSQNESYKVTDESVVFDLMKLNENTIYKIQKIIGD